MSVKIEKITLPNKLAEGPHWDDKKQKLYYVDIVQHKIMRLDPVTGKLTSAYLKDAPVGFVVPVKNIENKLVVGCGLNIVLVTWDGENDSTDPPTEKLASFDKNCPNMRINDGKCDINGRLWSGTMAIQNCTDCNICHCIFNCGDLYSLNKNLIVKKTISSIGISNGISWSPKNDVMYFIDSLSYQIWAFDYNYKLGEMVNKKVIFDLKKNSINGIPDGMTTDTNGNLWIAVYNGACVIQVDPRTGKLLRTIKLPANEVTSVCFGGPNFDILYVTTARILTEQTNVDAGCIYSIKGLGVQGFPSNNFKLKKKF